MTLESIKDTLTSLGYLILPYGDEYISVVRKMSDDDPWDVEMEDYFCRVTPIEGRINVIYRWGNTPDEIDLDSESEVIAFIKKQFPL